MSKDVARSPLQYTFVGPSSTKERLAVVAGETRPPAEPTAEQQMWASYTIERSKGTLADQITTMQGQVEAHFGQHRRR